MYSYKTQLSKVNHLKETAERKYQGYLVDWRYTHLFYTELLVPVRWVSPNTALHFVALFFSLSAKDVSIFQSFRAKCFFAHTLLHHLFISSYFRLSSVLFFCTGRTKLSLCILNGNENNERNFCSSLMLFQLKENFFDEIKTNSSQVFRNLYVGLKQEAVVFLHSPEVSLATGAHAWPVCRDATTSTKKKTML